MVPDYYAMLEVDPGADRAAIEAALARCQPKWSSGTRNPKTKHTFQSYLDQIPSIRRALLGDPSTRAAYDAERAASARADRDARLDELLRLLRLRAAKGGLTVSDRNLLRGEAVRLGLAHEDLDRLAEAIPPRPEIPDDVDPPDPPADVIDAATRRQVRVSLHHLRKRDLYDVLGLPRDAATVDLMDRADAERRRWMQKTQVTAEKTAWLEAISYAQSHLATPEARRRYDRTLVVEAEETLGEAIGFALKGVTRLDPGTNRALVDEAGRLGIAPDRAGRLIDRRCRAQGIARTSGDPAGPDDGPPRLLRCRSCGGVTTFTQATRGPGECRHCRAPLRWDCPSCHRALWADEARCPCGFPLESLEPLVRHFEAAQHAHRSRDHATALDHLHQVQRLAPHHVGARKAIEKVKDRLAAIDRARSAYEVEAARRHLVAARKAVEAWALLVDPLTPDLRSARDAVTRGLREALALAIRARDVVAADPAAASDLLRRSLAIAADLPEAREGLGRCPPGAPTALRIEQAGERLRLRWAAPPGDGLGPVTYRVLRKTRGVPAHSADGTVVAEVAATEWDDPAAAPGEVVGYGVFGRRGEVESPTGASAGPVTILGEVSEVRVEAIKGEVQVTWRPPRGSTSVRAVRKAGVPPRGPEDGTRVETLRDGLVDRGLDDDKVYHYGVYAVYEGPDGRPVASRGVVVSAMPHAPVRGVDCLSALLHDDGRVRLEWEEPERGGVRILRSPRPPEVAPGDRLDPAEVMALAGLWIDAEGPGLAVDPHLPMVGSCHYTPFTAWAGGLIAGRGVTYSSVQDPSDLRAVRVGSAGKVHLRWRWSPQGSQALIVARTGRFAIGPDDPDARRMTVQDVEYGRQGYFALNLPPGAQGAWHISVYGIATVDGDRVVSPGLDPTARTVLPGPHPEITVSYSLRPPRFPGRRWSLTFRTEPPGASIPPTALIAHPRTVPLTVDDGEVVDHFPESRDGATFRIRTKVNLASLRARVFADPRSEPDGLPPIRLRHPEAGGTRV